MKSTIVFIAILCIASAGNFRSARKAANVLAEIDSSNIGNIILSQLQIHLAAEGPVDDVVALVGQFIQECNDSQAAADAQHNEDQAVCDHEISTSWGKYEHHTNAHDVAVQTVADTQGLLAAAEDNLASTIQEIADLTRMIEEGTALRAEQAALYAERQARHQMAIDALDEAIGLVSALYHSPGSFVQLRSKVEAATSALSSLSHLAEFEMYEPIIKSLAEIQSGTLQSNAVGQILELLQDLRYQIQSTKDEETAIENQRIADWATLLSHLTNQKNNATTRKNTLENNIENYHGVIEANEAAAIMHAAEAERFFDLHGAWVAGCDEKQASYDKFTALNQGDLSVLTRLHDYLVEAFASVEDYIVERVNE